MNGATWDEGLALYDLWQPGDVFALRRALDEAFGKGSSKRLSRLPPTTRFLVAVTERNLAARLRASTGRRLTLIEHDDEAQVAQTVAEFNAWLAERGLAQITVYRATDRTGAPAH